MYCNTRDMYYNPYYSQSVVCQGPSPVIPFLLLVCLGLLICWESMMEYYEMLFEVKESVEELPETLPLIIILIIGVVILSYGFMCDTVVTVVPIAVLLFVFLLQDEVLCVLVLLLVLCFFAVNSYPSQNGGCYPYRGNRNQNRNWNWSRPVYQSRQDCQLGNAEASGRRSDLPYNLTMGQLCYLMMVGCLTACTVFSEDQNIWWTCMALLLTCVLYFNYSGRGDREWIM